MNKHRISRQDLIFTDSDIASNISANRSKMGKFGFQKQQIEKGPTKRKLDLDGEESSKKQLVKLPTLPDEPDDIPYEDQDDDGGDESDGNEGFAGTEEEAAAAARAAHERREGRLLTDTAMDLDAEPESVSAPSAPEPTVDSAPVPEPMDVDDQEEEADPLDAFMADLKDTTRKPKVNKLKRETQEPEAYFSDEEEFGASKGADANAKTLLAIAAKRKKKSKSNG